MSTEQANLERARFRAWLEEHRSDVFYALSVNACPLAAFYQLPVIPGTMRYRWQQAFARAVDMRGHGTTVNGASAVQILDAVAE